MTSNNQFFFFHENEFVDFEKVKNCLLSLALDRRNAKLLMTKN